MYVCSCFGITEAQVKKHADAGACTPRQIASACKVAHRLRRLRPPDPGPAGARLLAPRPHGPAAGARGGVRHPPVSAAASVTHPVPAAASVTHPGTAPVATPVAAGSPFRDPGRPASDAA